MGYDALLRTITVLSTGLSSRSRRHVRATGKGLNKTGNDTAESAGVFLPLVTPEPKRDLGHRGPPTRECKNSGSNQ